MSGLFPPIVHPLSFLTDDQLMHLYTYRVSVDDIQAERKRRVLEKEYTYPTLSEIYKAFDSEIEAIKSYRKRTNASLYEAKVIIEHSMEVLKDLCYKNTKKR